MFQGTDAAPPLCPSLKMIPVLVNIKFAVIKSEAWTSIRLRTAMTTTTIVKRGLLVELPTACWPTGRWEGASFLSKEVSTSPG